MERESDAEPKIKTKEADQGSATTSLTRNDKQLNEIEKKRLMAEHFNKATQLYQQKKYGEAIAEWEEVLKLDPEHKLSQQKIETARKQLKLKK
ncbi:MAG: tetratricopeptide repeat protein [Elusimicrobiota bacterium]